MYMLCRVSNSISLKQCVENIIFTCFYDLILLYCQKHLGFNTSRLARNSANISNILVSLLTERKAKHKVQCKDVLISR